MNFLQVLKEDDIMDRVAYGDSVCQFSIEFLYLLPRL